MFAELGADVIKVEPAPNGDHTRGLGGFGAGFFAAFNRNKRSLAVDLKREEGQAVIHRLVSTTDVILENFGPGTMERAPRRRQCAEFVADSPPEEAGFEPPVPRAKTSRSFRRADY